MHIIVPLRLVPDLSAEIAVAADGRSVDREWLDLKLDEFDDQALEEAIIIKEATGAKVTAVALAGDGADRMLQNALARGADQVFKLEFPGPAPALSRAVAPLFADAILHLGGDVVLTGVQTSEDIFGQLAPYLGAALDWPQASAVTGVETDGNGLIVRQEFGGGVSATLRLSLPAVVGIQTASQPVRYVAGSKLRQAMAVKVATMSPVKPQSAPAAVEAALIGLAAPDRTNSAIMFEGDPATIANDICNVLTTNKVRAQ